MKPYYQDDFATIYLGDSESLIREVGLVDSVVTDPVWPNADPSLHGANNPFKSFSDVVRHTPSISKRLVVQLGCDSDPRILNGVPDSMPFFRVCWLEYVRPNYKGRLLYTGDVAYVFGDPPKSRKGAHVLPGRCLQNDAARVNNGHPCPRQLAHVRWLVGWFTSGIILDPFCGSGTTLVAAKEHGRKSIGIEIEERYCEIAAKRLAQEVLPL